MTYEILYSTVVAILTAIITGGFILVFVEIGNRKNREMGSFYQSADPFMKKLSSYLRMISWCQTHIKYPSDIDEKEENFKSIVDKLSKYGSRLIMSGKNYRAGSFTASQIDNIANDINNIWYWHDKMNPCRLQFDKSVTFQEEFVRKEISEINPVYLSNAICIRLISDISGDLYVNIYQPIENDLYMHEVYIKQYAFQTRFVSIGVFFVLVILCSMTFISLPVWLLRFSTVFAIAWLGICLLLLGIGMNSQILYVRKVSTWWTSIRKKIRYIKP